MKTVFDHEKLTVYQKSLQFIVWVQKILERIPKKYSVNDQLDRSSTSIPLNIAEGNGKYSKKDRCRYFDIARGSALESAGALDVLVAKGLLKEEEILKGKKMLFEIVSMLVGLIKIHSDNLNSKQKRDQEDE
ncbi:MAG: four helix bundle protein [Deltaproteobacteria bacterium]|nr:four helix bundle protein [Deltaproteobacteria bacterium]